ncbi:hypothetical protein ABNG02_05930 [Halorubrum ejinorense]|uniref:Uncharacterized protein n=1 Tax=Halorubrum ejinorense TaxID=425309 RepID=A0AAV3STS0_9EURY
MTGNNPIAPDAFATAVESLDRDAFAAFVGEAYEATADAVDVDGPRVTVSTDGRRTELLVVSAADEGVAADGVDAVVVASEPLLDDGSEPDAEVVTPADLRERLLYAVPTAEANAIADRTLGLPVRSAAYDPVPGDGGDAARDDANVRNAAADAAGGEGDVGGDQGGVPSAAPESAAANSPPSARTAPGSERSQPRDRPTDSADATRGSGETVTAATVGDRETATDRSDAETAADRSYPRSAVAVVVAVALLTAAVGAGFVAGTAGVGGPDGIAGIGGKSTDSADPESGPTGSTDGGDDGDGATTADGDAANTAVITDGNLSDEAARNTAPTPTCERSALQVVQIQMNALRYNDNATNDGVRTLRAFASPENREVVGSVEEYAELFDSPRYAPMLTYDTAQYSVPVIDDDAAEVEVVTRENGSVTGRYVFRLELVTGGSAGGDVILGDVDDCWMTDAVAAE